MHAQPTQDSKPSQSPSRAFYGFSDSVEDPSRLPFPMRPLGTALNAVAIQGTGTDDARISSPASEIINPKDIIIHEIESRPPSPSDDGRYRRYTAANEIRYTPETALKAGLAMVEVVKANILQLNLGSDLRKEVWIREVERLQNQVSPPTVVAICGATGAGKSSIINAVLDDDVVPTSGMRACTSVVTEIAYHPSDSIHADIEFLSEEDWRAELTALLEDIAANGGSSQRRGNDDVANIAWEKVHAVYPSIPFPILADLTVDEIMSVAPDVADVLGSTITIQSPNSATFREEISQYIDSKCKTDTQTAALWPLILKVNIRCPAEALSTGCRLVDLPGANDLNAARNNIAKQYMKRCDCVWVLAPITRAVSDKTARDLLGEAFRIQMKNGRYDSHAITFIATKCDDVSPREVIDQLNLAGEPTLVKTQHVIEDCEGQIGMLKQKKTKSEHVIASAERCIDESQRELEKCLQSAKVTDTPGQSPRKKRKNAEDYFTRSRKRRLGNSSKSNQHEAVVSDAELDDRGNGSNELDSAQGSERQLLPEANRPQGTITSLQDAIKAQQVLLSASRKELIDILSALQEFEQKMAMAETDRKQFCALMRSQFASETLKDDFRKGLKDLDDATAEEQDPDNFDPDEDLRDYDAVDLPVFTCSARDYAQLTNKTEVDNRSSCFSQVDHTGIPQLQSWCHQLTVSSRQRVARNFLSQVKISATSIKNYVQRVGDVTPTDREAMRRMWKSSHFAPEADDDDTPTGVTARLAVELGNVIEDCVNKLKNHFREGLEGKCVVGASNAAEAAVATTQEYADSMHFHTFRAALRRLGTHTRDLNVELLIPFTRNIAQAWCNTFQTDMFTALEAGAVAAVGKLLSDVEQSAPPGLKDYAAIQAKLCVEMTKVAMNGTVDVVKESLNSEQREVSRSMAPEVQAHLRIGYNDALQEKGRGSVARQKSVMYSYIDGCKDDMFNGGARVIIERLSEVARSIGNALTEALEELAEKIEISLAVLWEDDGDDANQASTRMDVMNSVEDIIEQIDLWQAAEQTK